MMDVFLKIDGTQGDEGLTFLLGRIDIDPKYVAGQFTLAELNMLHTHLSTFSSVVAMATRLRNTGGV